MRCINCHSPVQHKLDHVFLSVIDTLTVEEVDLVDSTFFEPEEFTCVRKAVDDGTAFIVHRGYELNFMWPEASVAFEAAVVPVRHTDDVFSYAVMLDFCWEESMESIILGDVEVAENAFNN